MNIDTIVFDWGDTLMVNFTQFQGKMKDWLQVAAVPGAQEVLTDLSGKYRLVIASNAQDSYAQDISAALDRVGLSQHIEKIYTRHELGAEKTNPLFLQNLATQLQRQADQILMVGDEYQRDILPAISVGFHTLWFNPTFQTATAHLPLQEMECSSLLQIPKLIMQQPYPSYMTCIDWYLQHGATHTLFAHVHLVAAASYQMAIWFQQNGIEISPLLAHRGGLLHDLAKLNEANGENHAEMAARILQNYGQSELALIAARHLIGNLTIRDQQPQSWEEKIVNYCDKLCEGSQLVALRDRLDALQTRYPEFASRIQKNTPVVEALQDELVSVLNLTSAELLSKLKTALYKGEVESR